MLNIRDDTTFLSPVAIETAVNALSYDNKQLNSHLNKKNPLNFYNYFILSQDLMKSFRENFNVSNK